MDVRKKQYNTLTVLRRGLEYAQEVTQNDGRDIVAKRESAPIKKHTVFPEGFTPPAERSEEEQ